MASDRPIAWLVLEEGTRVHASDGEEVGRVARVIADEQKDIFSGVVLRSGLLSPDRFVPADLVDDMSEGAVRLKIASADVERLNPYEG